MREASGELRPGKAYPQLGKRQNQIETQSSLLGTGSKFWINPSPEACSTWTKHCNDYTASLRACGCRSRNGKQFAGAQENLIWESPTKIYKAVVREPAWTCVEQGLCPFFVQLWGAVTDRIDNMLKEVPSLQETSEIHWTSYWTYWTYWTYWNIYWNRIGFDTQNVRCTDCLLRATISRKDTVRICTFFGPNRCYKKLYWTISLTYIVDLCRSAISVTGVTRGR